MLIKKGYLIPSFFQKCTVMIIQKISAEQTYETRKVVLRENIPLPYEFQGDHDKDTLHFGAFKEGQIVGVSSFMKVQLPGFPGIHYQLRGMATLKEFQGSGVGKNLLAEAENELKKKASNLIWCNARVVAVDFYKKNGFQTIGEAFNIELIGPHYKMVKKL